MRISKEVQLITKIWILEIPLNYSGFLKGGAREKANHVFDISLCCKMYFITIESILVQQDELPGSNGLHCAAQDLPGGNITWHSTSDSSKVEIWNKNGKQIHAMYLNSTGG